jgi:hypothetical protein
MRVDNIKTFIKSCIEKGVKVPPLLVGTMGVGKSHIVKQIAQELNMKLVDLRLAQQESGDLIGLPYKNGDGCTHWAKPEWWPKEGDKTIVFLDELNRAPNDVRQAVFQLILDRKLHTHILPDTCYVVSAINPDNGNYQVEQLDPAMLRRFCAIAVTPDVDTWLTWAKNNKIHNDLTEFVNSHRKMLFQEEEIKLDVKPTPDSYRMLNEMVVAGVIKKDIQQEIFQGMLGKETSISLIKFLDTHYERPVSGTQVLKELAKFTDKIKKQRTDETYTTIQDLVACLSEDKRILDKDEVKNLVEFILMIGKESQAALIGRMPIKARELVLKDKRVETLLLNIISQ